MAVNFEKMLCGTLILCFLRAFGVGVKVGASVNSVSVVAVAVGVCWLLVFLRKINLLYAFYLNKLRETILRPQMLASYINKTSFGDNTRRKQKRLKSEGNLDEAHTQHQKFMALWLKSRNAPPFPSLKIK